MPNGVLVFATQLPTLGQAKAEIRIFTGIERFVESSDRMEVGSADHQIECGQPRRRRPIFG